jgi:carbonic anhydrase
MKTTHLPSPKTRIEIWALCFALTLMALPAAEAAFQPAKAETETGEHAEWEYNGPNGPTWWGSLSTKYHLCRDGHRQSPVDLNTNLVFSAKGRPIKIAYQATPIDEFFNGHTIQENVHNHSVVEYDGREYELIQFHFHSGSEHTLNGRRLDLELHLVHRAKDGKMLVIGVLFVAGEKHEQLDPVLNHVEVKIGKQVVNKDVTIDVKQLIPHGAPLFSYDGSLTTPPATEDIRWFVYEKPMQLSPKQLQSFRMYCRDNNRPVQPLRGRMLLRYE